MGRAFWALAAGRLISALGDGFFFPFTALFLKRVHGVEPAQVGLIMGLAGVFSLLGRLPAGAITDRVGFKPVVVVGLVGAGLATIAAAFAPEAWLFALCYALLGMMVWGSFPAFLHGVALLVPPARREEAFSIMNLIANGAITVGPALGALVVERDIRLLFVIDGLSFFLFALIVWRWVPAVRGGHAAPHAAPGPASRTAATDGQEPGPRGARVADAGTGAASGAAAPVDRRPDSGRGTGRGWLRDLIWLPPLSQHAFWRMATGALLMNLIYSQMGSTLPIDIESRFGPIEWYGLLWTLNGGMIALLQYPVTRWVQRYDARPRLVLAALLYGAAALLLLRAEPVAPFVVAFVVLTCGEILFTPLLQAGVAALAPPGQGGRYQAAGSLLFGLGWTLGPVLGGFLLGRAGHDTLWAVMVALGVLAAGIFAGNRLDRPAAPRMGAGGVRESGPAASSGAPSGTPAGKAPSLTGD